MECPRNLPKSHAGQIAEQYNQKYQKDESAEIAPIRFAAPAGYVDSMDHFSNFFQSVRSQKPIVEDATFGFRAAAPCLACNQSYFEKKVIHSKPIGMKMR